MRRINDNGDNNNKSKNTNIKKTSNFLKLVCNPKTFIFALFFLFISHLLIINKVSKKIESQLQYQNSSNISNILNYSKENNQSEKIQEIKTIVNQTLPESVKNSSKISKIYKNKILKIPDSFLKKKIINSSKRYKNIHIENKKIINVQNINNRNTSYFYKIKVFNLYYNNREISEYLNYRKNENNLLFYVDLFSLNQHQYFSSFINKEKSRNLLEYGNFNALLYYYHETNNIYDTLNTKLYQLNGKFYIGIYLNKINIIKKSTFNYTIKLVHLNETKEIVMTYPLKNYHNYNICSHELDLAKTEVNFHYGNNSIFITNSNIDYADIIFKTIDNNLYNSYQQINYSISFSPDINATYLIKKDPTEGILHIFIQASDIGKFQIQFSANGFAVFEKEITMTFPLNNLNFNFENCKYFYDNAEIEKNENYIQEKNIYSLQQKKQRDDILKHFFTISFLDNYSKINYLYGDIKINNLNISIEIDINGSSRNLDNMNFRFGYSIKYKKYFLVDANRETGKYHILIKNNNNFNNNIQLQYIKEISNITQIKKLPRLSIIIAVYNSENFLGVAIKSILNQEYKDFELILVNDGSRDKSYNLCLEYQKMDNRIRVFLKRNEGPSATRNFGFLKARGIWMTYIDSDDFVRADIYKDLINIIIDKNINLVMCDFSRVRSPYNFKHHLKSIRDIMERDTKLYYEFVSSIGEDKNKYLSFEEGYYSLNNYYFRKGYAWIYIYNRKIFFEKEVSFPNNIRVYEDEVFINTLIYAFNNYYHVDYPYYKYLMRNGSLVSQVSNYYLVTSQLLKLKNKIIRENKLTPYIEFALQHRMRNT